MNSAAIRHILLAHDFAGPAQAALECALRFADEMRARITVVHAYDLPVYAFEGVSAAEEVETAVKGSARAALDQVVADARRSDVVVEGLLRQGKAWLEIARAAAEIGADLAVVGTHGRRGLKHAVLGSVAEKVVRTAPCPVLVVHAPAAALA